MSGECDKCNEHALECKCESFCLNQRNEANIDIENKSIPEYITYFLKHFHCISKIEADFIEKIASWPDHKKQAYLMAKKIFEDNEEK